MVALKKAWRKNGQKSLLALLLIFSIGINSKANTDASDENFKRDFQQASEKLKTVIAISGEQMGTGDFTGANAKLLSAFPEATRTPAESFLLGNVLFEADRKLSYSLHQAAVKAEPANSAVIWEWALEQHRAGEYAGALNSYQQYSKAHPGSAAAYALQADCLLRLNRVDEAVTAWAKSEEAPNGTIEEMEDLVCTVHREPAPHKKRAELLAKATRQQDVLAACDLIALDCDFPRDWWNGGPLKTYLTHDLLEVKTALKLAPEDLNSRTIQSAAACAIADTDGPEAIRKILGQYEILTDKGRTIPTNGGLLSVIVNAGQEAKAFNETELTEQIQPRILETARKGHDAALWNVALSLAHTEQPDELLKREREGWQATGDARFAAGVLLIKHKNGQLTGNDPDLLAALKQFPDSGLIQRVNYEVAKSEKRLTSQLLQNAAKAEFNHFTTLTAVATVVDRPRSDYLRQYFAELQQIKPAGQ
jgi:tetratricopeptide (TPR) repeat protein